MAPSFVKKDHRVDKQERKAGDQHARAQRRGPQESKILCPVDDRQNGPAKEEKGADPPSKPRGDLVLFEVASSNLPNWRPDQALVVVYGAAQIGTRFYLLLRVGNCLLQSVEHCAIRSFGSSALKAGVMNGVLSRNHTLIPRLRLVAGVVKRQLAWRGHAPLSGSEFRGL